MRISLRPMREGGGAINEFLEGFLPMRISLRQERHDSPFSNDCHHCFVFFSLF